MAKTNDEICYEQLMMLNERVFAAGNFKAAYHALASAMYCAERIQSDKPLKNIMTIALEQNEFIDKNFPEYEHSTRSANKRKIPESILARLSKQAELKLKLRHINRGAKIKRTINPVPSSKGRS